MTPARRSRPSEALHQTTVTLGKVQTYANVLAPTAEEAFCALVRGDVRSYPSLLCCGVSMYRSV